MIKAETGQAVKARTTRGRLHTSCFSTCWISIAPTWISPGQKTVDKKKKTYNGIKRAFKRIQLQVRGHTHHLFGEADGARQLPQLFLIQSQRIGHVHTVTLTSGGGEQSLAFNENAFVLE